MSEYFRSRRNINILFLGGAKRVSMAEQLIKAGAGFGIEVKIFSHELSPCEPIASIGTIITGNKYLSPEIDTELDEIIANHDIHILLPFIDPAIEVAARCKERHPEVFVPVSSEEVAKTMFDKMLSAQAFENAGIPIPTTYNDSITFPAILKPRKGSASKGIIIARNADDLNAATDPDGYLIQEYISDREEYTVDCYVGTQDKEVKCAVPRIRLATAGGEVIRTETRRIQALESLSGEILKKLHLEGAVTLQFLHDLETGRFLLMEVNPRLGGGVICSICAGANIAKMIISESIGINAMPVKDWQDGVLMTRYMKEVIFKNNELQ